MKLKNIKFGKSNIYYEQQLAKKCCPCRKLNKNITLLVISDSHDGFILDKELEKKLIDYKDYDLCCILGDISDSDYEIILKYVPKEKIVALLGNHDRFGLLEQYNLYDINGRVITVNGIRISGIQGCNKYKNESFPSYTQKESINFLDKMEEVDILLSHDKPFLIDNKDSVHDGLKGITKYLYKNKVPYNIHGHLHKNQEQTLLNGTKSIGVHGCRIIRLSVDFDINKAKMIYFYSPGGTWIVVDKNLYYLGLDKTKTIKTCKMLNLKFDILNGKYKNKYCDIDVLIIDDFYSYHFEKGLTFEYFYEVIKYFNKNNILVVMAGHGKLDSLKGMPIKMKEEIISLDLIYGL